MLPHKPLALVAIWQPGSSPPSSESPSILRKSSVSYYDCYLTRFCSDRNVAGESARSFRGRNVHTTPSLE